MRKFGNADRDVEEGKRSLDIYKTEAAVLGNATFVRCLHWLGLASLHKDTAVYQASRSAVE